MSVASFSIKVNGGKIPDDDDDHLGLILGVGIPLLLICNYESILVIAIFMVLYCVCVKNKMTNPRWSNSPAPV